MSSTTPSRELLSDVVDTYGLVPWSIPARTAVVSMQKRFRVQGQPRAFWREARTPWLKIEPRSPRGGRPCQSLDGRLVSRNGRAISYRRAMPEPVAKTLFDDALMPQNTKGRSWRC